MVKGTAELQRPVPLYMQVTRQLRARIASGELAEGDRIPSQREMMERWRISMQTASKVIGALKTEGLAIPSVGRDTIVAPGAAARISAAAEGTAHTSPGPPESAGRITAVKATKSVAPADVAEILGIPNGRRALRRQETRSRDDDHVVNVTTTWYPTAIAEKAPRLADSEPIPSGTLAYITETTATRATRAIEETSAAPASDDVAAALGITPGSPTLVIRTRYYAADGKIIEYAESTALTGHHHIRTYTLTGH